MDEFFPLLALAGGLLLWSFHSILEGETPVEFVVLRVLQIAFAFVGAAWLLLIAIRRVRK